MFFLNKSRGNNFKSFAAIGNTNLKNFETQPLSGSSYLMANLHYVTLPADPQAAQSSEVDG